ncbi:winged helix DNA-binding protein [Gymnodinialimonas hymeniacidonis]|uniref:winged helix DNA-binding protein n=1 Tax=Gymnodinialimonas hymeniacidonis TaxID=3126508 RepID=UPI0034C5DE55
MSDTDLKHVVSSAHLADSGFPEVSEFEFGLTLANHGFHRWMMRAIALAGHPDLSGLDVLVLHSTHHRGRPKTLADICLVLNIEDTHTVNYSVKKLRKAGLVAEGRQGKEKTVQTTDTGAEVCEKYRDIRNSLLLEALDELGIERDQVSRLSRILRLMAGQYDQAARAAATY